MWHKTPIQQLQGPKPTDHTLPTDQVVALCDMFYGIFCPECVVLLSSVASHPSLFSIPLVNTSSLAIDFVVEVIVIAVKLNIIPTPTVCL